MSDVPYGCAFRRIRFFSVTSAIAKNMRSIESGDVADAWYPITLFFSRAGRSPDLAAAQIVADHIGTIHHEIKFTIRRFRRYT
jgi:asparagine synthase (glutamine-hydrolysing)